MYEREKIGDSISELQKKFPDCTHGSWYPLHAAQLSLRLQFDNQAVPRLDGNMMPSACAHFPKAPNYHSLYLLLGTWMKT